MSLSKTAQSNRPEVLDLLGGPTDAITMGVDMNALSHILDRLTDLYPDPIGATAREVISNAHDATVMLDEADRKPIRVTTPTQFAPHFVVQDFGTGMSEEVLRNVYSQYGASTKTSDMKQIGAYGLGAKAPLAYCTEFFGETTSDGVTLAFKVSRERKGNFTTITSKEVTGKPNGTKISVPSRQHDAPAFHRAAKVYSTYGFSVPILIDGVEPEASSYSLISSAFELEPSENVQSRVWLHMDGFASAFKAVLMGQVPDWKYSLSGWAYDEPNGVNRGQQGYYGHQRQYGRGETVAPFLVELKPGVVDFSSSRDSITQNDRSKALAERVRDFIKSKHTLDLLLAAFRKLDNEQALAIFTDMVNVIEFKPGSDTLKFKDQWGNGKGVKVKRSDFTTDSGYDPTELFFTDHSPTILSGFEAAADYSYGTNYIVTKGVNSYHRGVLEVGNKNTVIEHVSKALKADKPAHSLPQLAIAALYGSNSHQFVRRGYHNGDGKRTTFDVLIITDAPEENAKTVFAWRSTLIKDERYSKSFLLFAKSGADLDAQIKFLEAHGIKGVKRIAFADMRAAVKEIRDRIAPKKIEAQLHVELLENDGDLIGDGAKYPRNLGSKKLTAAEIKKENAILVASNYGRERGVLIGASNAGVKLENRTVYRVHPEVLRAIHFQELVGYEGFLLEQGYKAKSKIAEAAVDGHTYHGTMLDADVLAMSEEHALGSFLATLRGSDYFRKNFLEHLKAAAPEDHLTAIMSRAKEPDSRRDRAAKRLNLEQVSMRVPAYAPTLAAFQSVLADLAGEESGQLVGYVTGSVLGSYEPYNEDSKKRNAKDQVMHKFVFDLILSQVQEARA